MRRDPSRAAIESIAGANVCDAGALQDAGDIMRAGRENHNRHGVRFETVASVGDGVDNVSDDGVGDDIETGARGVDGVAGSGAQATARALQPENRARDGRRDVIQRDNVSARGIARRARGVGRTENETGNHGISGNAFER